MDLNEALNRALSMMGTDDMATLALAGRVADLLPEEMTATVGVVGEHLTMTVTAPLVAEDVWTATVRARVSPGGTLESMIDDDQYELCPSPDIPSEVERLVKETVHGLRFFHGRDRSRFCTGVVDEADGFVHYSIEGNCPVHPNAELLEA